MTPSKAHCLGELGTGITDAVQNPVYFLKHNLRPFIGCGGARSMIMASLCPLVLRNRSTETLLKNSGPRV